MTRIRVPLLASFLMMLVVCGAGEALAVTVYWDPYDGSGSTVMIGADPNDGSQWIAWRAQGATDCYWQEIGDVNGLWDRAFISGGNGDDHMLVASGPFSFCGWPFVAPIYGGHSIDLYGGDGNDVLTGYHPFVNIAGGSGDDIINIGSGSGDGGEGNDLIWATGSSPGGVYTGGPGSDCIDTKSASQPAFQDCGSEFDAWAGKAGTTRPASCEFTVFQCVPED